jgi:predicted flap endonuclease-1-like 5' DNA nuclease
MWSIIPVIWFCLLIAALLGGIIGWLLRSISCKKASDDLQARINERDSEISRLRTSVSNVKGNATTENAKDDAEISALKARIAKFEAEAAASVEARTAEITKGEAEISSLKARISTFENESAASLGAGAAVMSGVGDDTENAKLRTRIAELEAKLDETEGERTYLLGRMKKAESGESIARVVPMDQRDDLEAINGVGPVLEGMLYDMGIYFFKDVASWDDAKIDEVSEQLPRFKNRIRREGWVESAKDEHFKKYGEKL